MPPQRRRDGYREGQISDDLRGAISSEAHLLDAVEDPIERIRAVGDAFAALDDSLAELASVRLRAIRELREEGWSYDRIASATHLSKGRVQQLVAAAAGLTT